MNRIDEIEFKQHFNKTEGRVPPVSPDDVDYLINQVRELQKQLAEALAENKRWDVWWKGQVNYMRGAMGEVAWKELCERTGHPYSTIL